MPMPPTPQALPSRCDPESRPGTPIPPPQYLPERERPVAIAAACVVRRPAPCRCPPCLGSAHPTEACVQDEIDLKAASSGQSSSGSSGSGSPHREPEPTTLAGKAFDYPVEDLDMWDIVMALDGTHLAVSPPCDRHAQSAPHLPAPRPSGWRVLGNACAADSRAYGGAWS